MTDHQLLVPRGQRWKVVVARARPVLLVVAALLVFGPLLARLIGIDVASAPGWAFPSLFGVALLTMYLPAFAVDGPPTMLDDVPLRGRWLAMNSPATRVPSHMTLAYGQSHAVDLVLDPEDGSRPDFGDGPAFPPPEDYPAFGAPILAPVDGVALAASDWRRDHRSRATYPAIAYLFLEGMLREVGGAGFVIGNHVVVQRDDGRFVLLAHLQQGSVVVSPGDRVSAGDRLASCGNSGNSSEPHLHVQVMDHRRASMAAGLPFGWVDATVDGEADHGIPANGAHLIAE